jgi:uncharacterized protein
MLMMIGPVRLQIAPFNVTEYSQTRTTGFVAKPVLGGREPMEYVGEGPATVNVTGKLFPEKFGGLSALQVLDLARASGTPQWLMRGDGGMMGWVVIESVTEQASFLDRRGVGKMIDVDIRLRRVGIPLAATFFSALSRLFG